MTTTLPRVILTAEATETMVDEILNHSSETAWALYGLVLADKTVIINGVLRPTPDDVHRQYSEVTIGGEGIKQAVLWLAKNWRLAKRLNTTLEGARFVFFLYGHKHPWGFDELSPKDINSIVTAVEIDGLDPVIAVLAIARSNKRIRPSGRRVGTLLSTRYSRVWLRFYYLDKSMVDVARATHMEPVPAEVIPEVVDEKTVPMSPPLGWHIVNKAHLAEQLRHLTSMGCSVREVIQNVEGGAPFEIQFWIGHEKWGSTTALALTTLWDFPKSPPKIQLYLDTGILEIAPNDVGWMADGDFIEIIFQLQRKGLLSK